jgi:hypothetical protein
MIENCFSKKNSNENTKFSFDADREATKYKENFCSGLLIVSIFEKIAVLKYSG